jgi:hypothetical protein
MDLRPLPITRVASVLPGCVVIGLGVERFEVSNDQHVVAAGLLAIVGVILAVRGYGLGAQYDDEALTIRGMFRTRKIRRSDIREITAFPAVRWSSASGRRLWTPIVAFAEWGMVIPAVARRNEEAIEELERWLRKRRR